MFSRIAVVIPDGVDYSSGSWVFTRAVLVSLAMGRMDEFHLWSGYGLRPNCLSKHCVSQIEQPFILNGVRSESYRRCWNVTNLDFEILNVSGKFFTTLASLCKIRRIISCQYLTMKSFRGAPIYSRHRC